MALKSFEREGKQLILHTEGTICTSGREVLQAEVFQRVVSLFCETLWEQGSPLLEPFLRMSESGRSWTRVVNLLRSLAETPLAQVASILPGADGFLDDANRQRLHQFVERLYDFWRSFDRFIVLHSEPGPSCLDQRPYRSFNATVEAFTQAVRGAYRDLCENITGDKPRVYRQVSAGCDVGLIAVQRASRFPKEYEGLLKDISFIRQVWITPPLIIDPPMNKRTGQFKKVDTNPFAGLSLPPEKWLCYPAQVGPIVVFIYFHQRFMGLACSLANLFEIATDEQISRGADAIYLYGAPAERLSWFGDLPTVFYDDCENNLLLAAVPREDRFGYFGYLKKMVLTLHNIAMMKQGRMPYHGAMVRVSLKTGASANVLIIGDTAAGKSESLEAFRIMGREHIRELRVIADDMGSLEVTNEGSIVAYGSEIGAFIRLDDLQQGYAFEQIDRAIIMSPQKVNARVVLPITTLDEVLRGYPVDYLLYANNYEQVDEDHPVLERFDDADRALAVFREGAAMAKGTTTSTGLVHSYFANIFGPPQYRELHEKLATRVFESAFRGGVYVGQLRTRLGIEGYENQGPLEAAKALFREISKSDEEK
ncbi:MAG: phosphoenolpyruvate carboxykinase [Thermodesulfobacteriota bacterium]